jgi:lambda family phage portal protein
MNALDRIIAALSPEAGLRRARARAAMSVVAELAYEGARVTRRSSGWSTTGTSANAEIGPSVAMLRDRSRDLVRNNPWATKAIEELVGNVVGTGIVAKTTNEALGDLWARFVDECDADGQLDFYGLQDLVERTRIESGECLVRLRTRRPEDSLGVPLQLQVLEPDYLDTDKSEDLGPRGRIVQGIEYGPIGNRVAYWMFTEHPGDSFLMTAKRFGQLRQSVRIPAATVIHYYRKLRPGQGRGVPTFAPVVVKARDIDELQEARLVKRKVEACLALIYTTADAQTPLTLAGTTSQDTNGNYLSHLEPGMISNAPPGTNVSIVDPSSADGLVDELVMELHAMAAGIGVTYQGMTGDLRQVNYSSFKAGRISFDRLVESVQWKAMRPMFLGAVWRKFVDSAALLSRDFAGAYAVEWTMPKRPSVDPEKDARADVIEIRSGLSTLGEKIRERGYDADAVLEEIAATNKRIDELDIVLDSDPRRVSQQGLAQSEPEEESEPPAKPERKEEKQAAQIVAPPPTERRITFERDPKTHRIVGAKEVTTLKRVS